MVSFLQGLFHLTALGGKQPSCQRNSLFNKLLIYNIFFDYDSLLAVKKKAHVPLNPGNKLPSAKQPWLHAIIVFDIKQRVDQTRLA
jgi:hypothetical protein